MLKNICKRGIYSKRLCSTAKTIMEKNEKIENDEKETEKEKYKKELDILRKDYSPEFEPSVDYNVEKYKDD